MSTALDIVKGALQSLKVVSVNAAIPIQSDDKTLGIRNLNMMMAAESVNNRSFGYTTISAETDEVTIPDWMEDYVESKLAIRLAPYYGKDIPRELVARYDAADRTVSEMVMSDGAIEEYFPENMPMGAGNEGLGGLDIYTMEGNSGAFFGPQHEDDLTDGVGEALTDDEGEILED